MIGAVLLSSFAAHAEDRVAIVVGLSRYGATELELPGAKDDAKVLARYLEETGGFRDVHLLVDGVATKSGIEAVLYDTGPNSIAEGDTLLFAFFGHGVGSDFGDPYFLAYDTDPENMEATGIRARELVQRISPKMQGRNLVMITDAAHDGQVGGVALLGPTAKDWPTFPGSAFVLSAGSKGEIADPTAFATQLLRALAESDFNNDGRVSASELHRELLVAVAESTDERLHPAEAGTYDPNLVVALTGKDTKATTPTSTEPVAEVATTKSKDERRGWGGPVSYSLMGLGVVGAGVGLYAQTQGLQYCDQGADVLTCPDDAEYTRWRDLQLLSYGTGGILAVAGIGLAFVPLEGGAAFGFSAGL